MKEKVILLNYYGAKNRIAGRYPDPRYDAIIEPFAGSAGYSCRHFERKVILVEKNPVVHGAVDFLIRSSAEDILRLPLIAPGDSLNNHDELCQEAKWFIGFWLNNGTVGGCVSSSAWRTSIWPNTTANYWGPSCRLRAAYTASKIKHWRIILGDYTDAPDVEATWFIDPPYQNAGKFYPCSSKNIDFNALGEWCKSRKGQVIVCENEGADWLPFQKLCEFVGTAKDGDKRKRSVEAVWMNA